MTDRVDLGRVDYRPFFIQNCCVLHCLSRLDLKKVESIPPLDDSTLCGYIGQPSITIVKDLPHCLHILKSLASIFQVNHLKSMLIFSILVSLWISIISLLLFCRSNYYFQVSFNLEVILYVARQNTTKYHN